MSSKAKQRRLKWLKKFNFTIRSLRGKMTLSYSLVTIGALLVAEIALVVFVMTYFTKNLDLTPETLIANLTAEWTPQIQDFLSQNPPDVEGVREYLEDVQGSEIKTKPLIIFGSLELQMKVQDFLNFYYLLADRTVVAAIPHGIIPDEELGTELPFDYLPGLEEPYRAALRGVEDQNQLYATVEPGHRIVGAIPVFRDESPLAETPPVSGKPVIEVERNLVGVIVFATKRFPWEFLPIGEVAVYIARSLLLFTFIAGIIGSIFGLLTARGLTERISNVSDAAHSWARGDFSVMIRDTVSDDIGRLTNDLNSMAEQLENMLDRRLELTVLEERNRLARDLHDSVKQQTFAASAQLGAAKAHFANNPQQALYHLEEAEVLIGQVRQELTDLIQELRPVEMKGKGLLPAIEEYAENWSKRNHVILNMNIRGERSLPLNVEKSLFRIVQEALANVAWHSHASKVDIVFNFRSDFLLLTIRDDGDGFNIDQPKRQGMGLRSMRERAELISGELIVDSRINLGTKVILKYPYQKLEL